MEVTFAGSTKNGRKFTQDWFSHNEKIWFEFLPFLKKIEPKALLEIGCFEGMATCWLLDNLMGKNDTIDVIDTFAGSPEFKEMGVDASDLLKRFVKNVNFDSRVKTHIGSSQDVLLKLGNEPIYDFIYIDGSHKAKNVMTDAILAWRLLKPDGIMIFDDYEWVNPAGGDFYDQPKPAINYFMHLYKKEMSVLFQGYQVILSKRS